MVFITCIIKIIIISHKEPIEGIKVWILLRYISNILRYPSNILRYPSNILRYPSNILRYPSNILRYPSKYCNNTSKKKIDLFLHSNPSVDNFFNIRLTKNIIDYIRCII